MVKIVVDHIAGSRRGQRQELDAAERVRFGRHPDNEVSFDAHRDLDASSRHAELRREDDGFVLVDVGSSNGLLVDGERISECEVPLGEQLEVEFGSGGPRIRLFIGDEIPAPPSAATLEMAAAPQPPERRARAVPGWLLLLLAVLVGAAVAIALVARAS